MSLLSLLLLLTLLFPTTTTTTTTTTTAVDSVPLLRVNSTIHSPNNTFQLTFFSPTPTPHHHYYLAISYSSLPTPTFIWVANRLHPLSHPTLSLSSTGQLTLSDSPYSVVWSTPPGGSRLLLLDSGNLILLDIHDLVLWQSFDHPTDTWLPGMNLTSTRVLTSWRSMFDPSPGRYSMRVRPPEYAEVELTYLGDDVGGGNVSYWRTGRWDGDGAFANVPEMTAPYIYRFYFTGAFTPSASLGYSETGQPAPLTRFQLTFYGELQQHTWSPQSESWNTFWARPESRCQAYGLCGPNGVCNEDSGLGVLVLKVCGCPTGFEPVDRVGWDSGDFSSGCRRVNECDVKSDVFYEMGIVSFDGVVMERNDNGVRNRVDCEQGCLGNCTCVGVVYNDRSNLCKNVFGSFVNLRNMTVDDIGVGTGGVLYLRVGRNELVKKSRMKHKIVLICVVVGLVCVVGAMCLVLFVMRRRLNKKMREEEEVALAATHLRVFSYKELHGATRGFSEKLGHGGFGTVFLGTLEPDGSHVAIKCLERPGSSGEKEFRAEVCTIGNVQHVNLVRLRGFCSEDSHRLLVYDYMPNGPLSGYLKDGLTMSWDVRYRVAMGTARALAYLHEECRDCIIHCDIKPENILLDWDYTPKVSDFGLAKLIGRDFSRVLATMRGTWGYVAPEWISGVAITTKADVYSYGMTMLELIGGRRNVEAVPSSQPNNGTASNGSGSGDKWFFPPWAARHIVEGKAEEVVDPRLGGAYDRVEAERLGLVAVWCIQDEEMARPSMGMVVKMLEGMVEVNVPPPPKLLQALVSGDSFPGVRTDGDSGSDVLSGGGRRSDRVSLDSVSHSPTKC